MASARAEYDATPVAYQDDEPVGMVTSGVDSEGGLLLGQGDKRKEDRIRARASASSVLMRLRREVLQAMLLTCIARCCRRSPRASAN